MADVTISHRTDPVDDIENFNGYYEGLLLSSHPFVEPWASPSPAARCGHRCVTTSSSITLVNTRPDSGDVGQPTGGRPAHDLSELEQALRRALGSVPRDQVVKCIVSVLPADVLLDENARIHGGKVRKVSVSMPEELAEAVRARTGTGGFSRYVTEAVNREIRHDLLGDLIEELEAEYGPVPPEVREETRREWPGYEVE
jgi:hypothetical protein